MNVGHDAVDAAITECDRLRKILKKSATAQVRSQEERNLIKATALTWFRTHRPVVNRFVEALELEGVDGFWKSALTKTDQAATRSSYIQLLKEAHDELSRIRVTTICAKSVPTSTNNDAPDFSPLISDGAMRDILKRRWEECVKCIDADAPLAAVVMMGGLLESLLLARVNRAVDKAAIFSASKAPRDKTGKALPLKEWTLRNYIDVAHELTWITQAAKDIGEIVRDYRNYIHPQKELSHGISLSPTDSQMFWEISKSIAKQVI